MQQVEFCITVLQYLMQTWHNTKAKSCLLSKVKPIVLQIILPKSPPFPLCVWSGDCWVISLHPTLAPEDGSRPGELSQCPIQLRSQSLLGPGYHPADTDPARRKQLYIVDYLPSVGGDIRSIGSWCRDQRLCAGDDNLFAEYNMTRLGLRNPMHFARLYSFFKNFASLRENIKQFY